MFSKCILMILDGWGIGTTPIADAILQADTPFYDQLKTTYAFTTLTTHGIKVGLPEGQMGNSEVGHLNLGAGRIVFQDLPMINIAIENQTIDHNTVLIRLFNYCNSNQKALHLIGLVSDGGVHSHINHLKHLITLAEKYKVNEIYLHAITDGRDTDPKSGLNFLQDITLFLKDKRVKISTIIGRYYAMDRDRRWERIYKAYALMTEGFGKYHSDVYTAIEESYEQNITDEFLDPIRITWGQEHTTGLIQEGDAVLCFNFRTDRLRELTTVLSQEPIPLFNMNPLNLYYCTLTNYDDTFKKVHPIFDKKDLQDTLGEILSVYGRSQLRIAESEKYPHVSFFFSGGREIIFSGEKRLLIPSPKVATYDLKPEMSAFEVTDALLNEIQESTPDFICINFANTDMVGHTGIFNAVIKAAETVDSCLSKIIPFALQNNYTILILADHGNGEYMINEDGSPNTAHTKNPVPLILVSKENNYKLTTGTLADIAPTILKIMDLPKPEQMTGQSLLVTNEKEAVFFKGNNKIK
ncbi:MAG: 2,3-bisphosphoglycerate-independent phosphoglycerate mutase [Bacteroidota bacterium]|nr:2,3-bisphosphoglycerate-independent phosphoglycerate mutase [Bacteroidota bacterium]